VSQSSRDAGNGNGRPGPAVMTLLLGGARFVDGVYVPARDAVSAA